MGGSKNFASLFKKVQKTLESSAKQIGVQGLATVRNQIEEDVYQKYTPKYYKRTGQLKKSLRYTSMKHSKGTYILFDHDKSKIESIKPSRVNNNMGQHHSTSKKYVPQKYNNYVAMVVHDGKSGDIFGDGEWRKPRPYMDKARVKVAKQANSITKQKLKERGFKVK